MLVQPSLPFFNWTLFSFDRNAIIGMKLGSINSLDIELAGKGEFFQVLCKCRMTPLVEFPLACHHQVRMAFFGLCYNGNCTLAARCEANLFQPLNLSPIKQMLHWIFEWKQSSPPVLTPFFYFWSGYGCGWFRPRFLISIQPPPFVHFLALI